MASNGNNNNFLSGFRFRRKPDPVNVVFKSITSGDTLHMDEEGKHLIFRTIDGKVRPIRVSAEEFAEWLSDNNVDIDPADQKTLRELDKELEIMERAADYGGPKLQKQYEDYFNERREQYKQVAGGYYQQALENQAENTGSTPEELHEAKQNVYEEAKENGVIRREDMERRGWDSALQTWVQSQDATNNLTPANDEWYYNRVFGVLVSSLIGPAQEGKPLSEINIDDVFSDEFVQHAMSEHYDEFFGGAGGDPKKIVAAVKTIQNFYEKDLRDNKNKMSNFVEYWYGRMEEDFSRDDQYRLESAPSSSGLEEIPEGAVPESLPDSFGPAEERALMGLYSRASGSKLGAAHRVMIHGLGRLVESIPLNERVSAAVELSDSKRGIHAVHKEGYKRAYQDNKSLGISPDREDLVREALSIMSKSSGGSTSDKVAAIKRVALMMGTMDGAAVLNSDPGIQEAQFTRKWHDSAVNAGRVKSEGPGLLELLTDDQKRDANIYRNEDLKIMHTPSKTEGDESEESAVSAPEKKTSSDLGDGYKFSGNKLYTPDGFSAEFEQTKQGYANVVITTPDKKDSFEARVYTPPIGLNQMSEEDKVSYLDSMKTQIGEMIEQYKRFNPSGSSEDEEGDEEVHPSFIEMESGSFRIPLFNFDANLTKEDRDFVGNVIELVDEANLSVDQVGPNIFRVTNPDNDKSYDLLLNSKTKRLVGAARDGDGNIVPFPEPGLEDLSSHLELKSS